MKFNVKKHKRKIITALIIVLILLIIFSPLLLSNIPLVNSDASKIEIISFVAQILSAIFVIVGTLIAVWQYYLSSRSNIMKQETERVQKAIDLSKYYKDEILHYYSILKIVYVKAGIIDILAKEKAKMKEFDAYELQEIFSASELNYLSEKFNSFEYAKAIIELNHCYNLGLSLCDKYQSLEDLKKITPSDKSNIIDCFNAKYCATVMNNIEHFAMYFTHNVADESVIYQSISPTYLEMCRYFYYNISMCSKIGGPKLYRNLKSLYGIWNKKDEDRRKEIQKHEVSEGTIISPMS